MRVGSRLELAELLCRAAWLGLKEGGADPVLNVRWPDSPECRLPRGRLLPVRICLPLCASLPRRAGEDVAAGRLRGGVARVRVPTPRALGQVPRHPVVPARFGCWASVGFSLEPPLFVRVTGADDVEHVESLLGERCPVPPVAAGSPAELLALRRDALDQVMHAAWEGWWETAAEYTRTIVRAAYQLEPKELPEKFLSGGRACEARCCRGGGTLGDMLRGSARRVGRGCRTCSRTCSKGVLRGAHPAVPVPEAAYGKKFGRDPFWLARVIDSAVPV